VFRGFGFEKVTENCLKKCRHTYNSCFCGIYLYSCHLLRRLSHTLTEASSRTHLATAQVATMRNVIALADRLFGKHTKTHRPRPQLNHEQHVPNHSHLELCHDFRVILKALFHVLEILRMECAKKPLQQN
jgi:hypothetical protein